MSLIAVAAMATASTPTSNLDSIANLGREAVVRTVSGPDRLRKSQSFFWFFIDDANLQSQIASSRRRQKPSHRSVSPPSQSHSPSHSLSPEFSPIADRVAAPAALSHSFSPAPPNIHPRFANPQWMTLTRGDKTARERRFLAPDAPSAAIHHAALSSVFIDDPTSEVVVVVKRYGWTDGPADAYRVRLIAELVPPSAPPSAR